MTKLSEPNLKDRNDNLNKIRNTLIKEFGNKVVSAIAYGSTLNEDFCADSDYDILMVVKKPDVKFLKKLREIKLNYMKEKIKIDFNVHSDEDIPSIRKDLFWHNNRGLYVQKEFDIYGKVLIGENLFKTEHIDNYEMLKEAVKVINSLNYQARKIMINKNI
ncbi:nucleotidyltransferase domain-containing protein, partial [Candidatus Woesearchaeota archaeon]|nr:nucleotidyltransferase domain-containing protein [Candidatus Woesearchaeota archaeon]